MWEKLKEFGKGVLRSLGLIKHIKKVQDHKKISIEEDEYNRIDLNKQLYEGLVPEWHNLSYKGSNGNRINRKMMTMNFPKIIAEKMASLVFNEGVSISLSEDSEKEKEWNKISDTLTSNKFKREFQRYLEYMFAMGGVAVEVYLDGDEIKLSYATADAFFPISSDAEQVDEAVIVNRFMKQGKYYTLMKWHEWDNKYIITNELYESAEAGEIGDKVALSKLYDDMADVTEFDIDRSLFVYIKPNIANNKHITSPLGLSIFDNIHDSLLMLDTMYDFWYNEFRLGKRRVAVPQSLVKTGIDINGMPFSYLDDAEELFTALNANEMDQMEIKDLTVDLRIDQIVSSINAILDIISMQVGLSAGSFTFSNTGLKTATQVVSEQSDTYRTRQSHVNVIEDALRDLIMAIYEVATLDENNSEPLEREDISIDFNDGIFQDKGAQADYYIKLYKAGLMPIKRVIQSINGLSDDEADDWIEEIREETAQADERVDEAVSEVFIGGAREQ